MAKRKFKDSTLVSYDLLCFSIENIILKPYALYIQIKAKFKHSIIFNFSYKKLVELTGLNYRTIKKYIFILQNHGFVEFHHGNLLFKAPRKIISEIITNPTYKFYKIPTRPWTDFRSILDRLYYLTIKINNRQQWWNVMAKFGPKYGKIYLDGKSFKKARKYLLNLVKNDSLKNFPVERRRPFHSTRQVAKLLNVSHMEALTILKRLQTNGYLKLKEDITDITNKEFQNLNEQEKIRWVVDANTMSDDGFYYIKNKKLKLHRGMKIKFLR